MPRHAVPEPASLAPRGASCGRVWGAGWLSRSPCFSEQGPGPALGPGVVPAPAQLVPATVPRAALIWLSAGVTAIRRCLSSFHLHGRKENALAN